MIKQAGMEPIGNAAIEQLLAARTGHRMAICEIDAELAGHVAAARDAGATEQDIRTLWGPEQIPHGRPSPWL